MTKFLVLSLISAFAAIPAFGGTLKGAHFAEGRVLNVVEVCKDVPNCKSRGAIRVNVEFALGGCMDKFGGAVHKYDSESKTLYVTGFSLENSESEQVRCNRQPTETHSITLYGASPKLSVVFLESDGDQIETPTRVLSGAGFASGRLLQIKEMCSSPNCKSRGTYRVTIEFDLGGCLNSFAGGAYYYDRDSKTLYVAGLSLHAKASIGKRCFRQPTEGYFVDVRGGDPKMKVVFLPDFN